ncbi:MAG: AAA family ATPase [Bacilli bacterium]
MIFKRKILDQLKEWKKNSDGNTAILIEGARRIGKSTVAEEFGKANYKSYITINFSTNEEAKKTFERNQSNLDQLFNELSVLFGTRLYLRDSLFIFDEVQCYPKARQLIKNLVADHRYDYLETGSLISIKQNVQDIVIPSEEKKLSMFPMDFEEFCWAINDETTIAFLKEHLKTLKPLGGMLRIINERLKTYMVVGGMPQSVVAYLKSKNFADCEDEKQGILDLYRDDIAKYAKGYEAKARMIFDSIPALLSHHDKKIVFSNLGTKGGRAGDFSNALYWMSDSKIAKLVYRLESIDPLAGFSIDDSKVKCYMSDTGLLLSLAVGKNDYLNNPLYKSLVLGKLHSNEGMMAENMVCQMLSNKNDKIFFFEKTTENRTKYEVDFVKPNLDKFDLVEVKSSRGNDHASILYALKTYSRNIKNAYILGNFDIKVEGRITYLPLVFASII